MRVVLKMRFYKISHTEKVSTRENLFKCVFFRRELMFILSRYLIIVFKRLFC